MNFISLKDSVQRYIIDNNISVVAEITDVVNEAIRSIQDRHNFKVYESKTTVMESTLDTAKLSDVPSDFKQPRSNPYIIDNSNNIINIEWAPNDIEMDKIYDPSTLGHGQPKFVLLYSNPAATSSPYFEFHLFPFPDQSSDYTNGNWRVVCPYWRYVSTLSADVDENFILNEYPSAIRYECIARLFWLNWDEQRAAVWEGKADKEIKRVVRHDKIRQFSAGADDTLQIRSGVRSPFNARRK